MTALTRGMFARSTAGHDKGRLYLVLEVGDRRVLLADGDLRPLEKPKWKNIRHIQPDHTQSHLPGELQGKDYGAVNAAIRKAIKAKEEGRCQKQM